MSHEQQPKHLVEQKMEELTPSAPQTYEYPYVHTYRKSPEGTEFNKGQVTFESIEQELESITLFPPLSHD
jgi:hypothetical protein